MIAWPERRNSSGVMCLASSMGESFALIAVREALLSGNDGGILAICAVPLVSHSRISCAFSRCPLLVMAALVPAIHAPPSRLADGDARNESGHDGVRD